MYKYVYYFQLNIELIHNMTNKLLNRETTVFPKIWIHTYICMYVLYIPTYVNI